MNSRDEFLTGKIVTKRMIRWTLQSAVPMLKEENKCPTLRTQATFRSPRSRSRRSLTLSLRRSS